MQLPLLAAVFSAILAAQNVPSMEDSVPTFGVSVVLPAGLTGQIYKLQEGTSKIPNFRKLKPIGTIYTHALAVPARDFMEGFPGISDIFEWFAIDYTGHFWVSEPGEYRFILTADDGAKLFIDDKRIIDNDGIHEPQTRDGKVKLKVGAHAIRVPYFQGPRVQVALVLEVQPPDAPPRIFSTLDFKPPSDLQEFQRLSQPSKQ
jgi:hypothetical protein